jgi:ubiquinone/menaquinone biosynthesis methyltransferase
MSKEVQRLFESIAPSYDFLNHALSLSIDKRWRTQVIAALGKKNPTRVLDLCAGTLDLTQKLLERFPKTQVISVDFALAMLSAGEKKIRKNWRAIRICADGHHLPFSDGAFDAVLCGFGIRNLEDREQASEEIHRVLIPGGKLVVLEFFRPNRPLAKLFYGTYGKHILPRIGGAISKNREAYEYLQNSIQNFFTVEEYQEFLEKRGFRNVQSKSLAGGIAHRVIAQTD